MRISALLDKISIVSKWPALRRPVANKTTPEVAPETLSLHGLVEQMTPDVEPKVVPVSLANVVKEQSNGTAGENGLPPVEPVDLVTLTEASDTSPQASIPVLPSEKTGTSPVSLSATIGNAQAPPADAGMPNAATASPEVLPSGVKQGATVESGTSNEEDLFKQLFNKQEEKEETPLDRLVAALPEVSMQELFDQAETVRALMREWPQ